MAKRVKKRKRKKARELITMAMILTRKGGPMKDKREPKKGSKNKVKEILKDWES
jgi:hypothetical protein